MLSKNSKTLTSKLKDQWIYDIKLFDIKVEHKHGSENFLTDAISRNPKDNRESTSVVNYDINPLFLMKSENFNLMNNLVMQAMLQHSEDTDLFLVSFEDLNEPIWINSENLHNKNLKKNFSKNKQKNQKR